MIVDIHKFYFIFQMTVLVMKKLNLLAQRTKTGIELNAYLKDGFVTETLIVWMEQMKIRRFIHVLHQLLALQINLLVETDGVLTWYKLIFYFIIISFKAFEQRVT